MFWLVNAAFAGAIVKPAISRVAAQAATAAEGPVGQQLDALRWSSRWSFGGDVLMTNDAAMLYLMTMKPGLTDSLLVVGAANLIVAAARATRLRTRRPGHKRGDDRKIANGLA